VIVYKLLGAEQSLSSASNVSGAKAVLIFNDSAATVSIVHKRGGTTIGSVRVASKSFITLEKLTSDTLETAGSSVYATEVAFRG